MKGFSWKLCEGSPALRFSSHFINTIFQRCIRSHVAATFGFSPTGAVLAPPTEEFKERILLTINQGGAVPKPYVYDWDSAPSSLYNLCIESSFSADFWIAAEGGLYVLEFIPRHYQRRKPFIKALRTYLRHIKRMLRLASSTFSRKVAFTKRCAVTSQKAMVGIVSLSCITFCIRYLKPCSIDLSQSTRRGIADPRPEHHTDCA